jgi:hypothetical protein
MTRARVAVVALLAAGGIAAGLLLSGGGNSNPAVAHVGGESITRDQLDATVDHFRRTAESEGTPFPDEKSARFRTIRNRLLGVLVYRTELAQAARRLGVHVANIQVLPHSLPATTGNFLKPWFFIDVQRGRVSSFYFALKFVD